MHTESSAGLGLLLYLHGQKLCDTSVKGVAALVHKCHSAYTFLPLVVFTDERDEVYLTTLRKTLQRDRSSAKVILGDNYFRDKIFGDNDDSKDNFFVYAAASEVMRRSTSPHLKISRGSCGTCS